MKKTKKGVTLVELIICCAIIVMLGGACTALLLSGEHIFSTSAKEAGVQADVNLLQSYMRTLLPPTKEVTDKNISNVGIDESYVYFDRGVFTIHTNGKDIAIDSITEFQYSIEKVGTSSAIADSTARARFTYTVKLKDGGTFSGGYVLTNKKYTADQSYTLIHTNTTKAITFDRAGSVSSN